MGARLRVFLSKEQDLTLLNLRNANVPPQVKERAEIVRLNAHGWYVEKISVLGVKRVTPIILGVSKNDLNKLCVEVEG
jgi:hypothetical protein